MQIWVSSVRVRGKSEVPDEEDLYRLLLHSKLSCFWLSSLLLKGSDAKADGGQEKNHNIKTIFIYLSMFFIHKI